MKNKKIRNKKIKICMGWCGMVWDGGRCGGGGAPRVLLHSASSVSCIRVVPRTYTSLRALWFWLTSRTSTLFLVFFPFWLRARPQIPRCRLVCPEKSQSPEIPKSKCVCVVGVCFPRRVCGLKWLWPLRLLHCFAALYRLPSINHRSRDPSSSKITVWNRREIKKER